MLARCDWTLTARCAGALTRAAFVGVARARRVGLRQREARETLMLLKALPVDVVADILEAAV